MDRAKVGLQDAQSKYDRAKSLRATNTTSAVALADTEVALSNARLALRDAELALQRRSIVAPIAGIIGIVPVEVGNYINAQSTVAMIDDRSSILVDYWVPERFADAVKVGAEVSATPISSFKDVLKGRSPPSTTASTKRAAQCWCRRRSPMHGIHCAPACPSK